MEGDAGASRLNPTDGSSSKEVTAEDSPESEVGDNQASIVTVEDVSEPVVEAAEPASTFAKRGPSRLGRRRWVIGVCAALVLLAAGVAAGGYYFGLRYHRQSQAVARDNAAAIAAAKDCVVATQAPDPAAVPVAQRKILECSTGDFGAQAALYGGMLAQAYQAANVHVQVSDMRAAVERDNNDGSVDVLVAVRTKVDNVEAQGQEYGYRLRLKMAREDGQYKVARLDQVGSK